MACDLGAFGWLEVRPLYQSISSGMFCQVWVLYILSWIYFLWIFVHKRAMVHAKNVQRECAATPKTLCKGIWATLSGVLFWAFLKMRTFVSNQNKVTAYHIPLWWIAVSTNLWITFALWTNRLHLNVFLWQVIDWATGAFFQYGGEPTYTAPIKTTTLGPNYSAMMTDPLNQTASLPMTSE